MKSTRPSYCGLAVAIAVMSLLLLAAIPTSAAGRLVLFGDDADRRFLGCLSCSRFDPDSVHNEFGHYGSRYSAYSIWNPYGRYGSPYSNFSPCNPYATRPPVVLDNDGLYYGRLTLNLFLPDAISEPEVVNWLRFVVCRRG